MRTVSSATAVPLLLLLTACVGPNEGEPVFSAAAEDTTLSSAVADDLTSPTPNAPFWLEHAAGPGERLACKEGDPDPTPCPDATSACNQCCRKKNFVSASPSTQAQIIQNNCIQDERALVTARGLAEAHNNYYPTILTGLVDGNGNPSTLPTLTTWLQQFKFPERLAGEPYQEFLNRAGYLLYYNRMELGLGRLLGCTQFVDGWSGNTPLLGQACFVTNYGLHFYTATASMQDAMSNQRIRNTVCITYRPSRPTNFQVQFWAYDGAGNRLDSAQLDPMGPRMNPVVCTDCHGGRYVPNDTCRQTTAQYPFPHCTGPNPGQGCDPFVFNSSSEDIVGGDADCGGVMNNCSNRTSPSGGVCINKHQAAGARFLPLNPASIRFPDDADIGVAATASQTRAGQMERLRRLNYIATRSPLSSTQSAYLTALYAGKVDTVNASIVLPANGYNNAGTVAGTGTAPAAWADGNVTDINFNPIPPINQQNLWNNVALPYCATCHLAIKPVKAKGFDNNCGCAGDPTNEATFDMSSFFSFRDYFVRQGIIPICKDFHMPHAMPTSKAFHERPAKVGATTYPTARQALFAALALNCGDWHAQASCESASNCQWGGFPNAFCSAKSGQSATVTDCGAPPFVPLQDGCKVASDPNHLASDAKCGYAGPLGPSGSGPVGPTQFGLVCDDTANTNIGKCQPGCRITVNGLGNANAPFRGCGPGYECVADGADLGTIEDCKACGSVGQPACATAQNPYQCKPGEAFLSGTSCVECLVDSDCSANPNGNKCDSTSKACVGCNAANPCPGGQTCNATSKQCAVSCAGDTCPAKQWCNSAISACMSSPELYPYQSIEGQFTSTSKTRWYKIWGDAGTNPNEWKVEVNLHSIAGDLGASKESIALYQDDGTTVITDSAVHDTTAGNAQAIDSPWYDSTVPNTNHGLHWIAAKKNSGLGKYFYIKTVGLANATSYGSNGYYEIQTGRINGAPTLVINPLDASYSSYIQAAVGAVDGSAESDYYKVVPYWGNQFCEIGVQLDSVPAQGDVDMELLRRDPAGIYGYTYVSVATSTSTSSRQTLYYDLCNSSNQNYYVRVYPKSNLASNRNAYLLTPFILDYCPVNSRVDCGLPHDRDIFNVLP